MFSYGFYNSLNGDRKYNAEQFNVLISNLINDGVLDNWGSMLMTECGGGGLQINVKSGRAWFNDTWSENDATLPLTLDASDPLLDRIDIVVLEVNKNLNVRANSIFIVKGTPSLTPSSPTLINTDDVHQHALASIVVRANTTEILPTDITIHVGTETCPFVTGILETASIEQLFAAWGYQFDTWFDDLKDKLSGDVATNLQHEIEELQEGKVNVSDKASSTDLIDGTPNKWIDAAGLKIGINRYSIGDVAFKNDAIREAFSKWSDDPNKCFLIFDDNNKRLLDAFGFEYGYTLRENDRSSYYAQQAGIRFKDAYYFLEQRAYNTNYKHIHFMQHVIDDSLGINTISVNSLFNIKISKNYTPWFMIFEMLDKLYCVVYYSLDNTYAGYYIYNITDNVNVLESAFSGIGLGTLYGYDVTPNKTHMYAVCSAYSGSSKYILDFNGTSLSYSSVGTSISMDPLLYTVKDDDGYFYTTTYSSTTAYYTFRVTNTGVEFKETKTTDKTYLNHSPSHVFIDRNGERYFMKLSANATDNFVILVRDSDKRKATYYLPETFGGDNVFRSISFVSNKITIGYRIPNTSKLVYATIIIRDNDFGHANEVSIRELDYRTVGSSFLTSSNSRATMNVPPQVLYDDPRNVNFEYYNLSGSVGRGIIIYGGYSALPYPVNSQQCYKVSNI